MRHERLSAEPLLDACEILRCMQPEKHRTVKKRRVASVHGRSEFIGLQDTKICSAQGSSATMQTDCAQASSCVQSQRDTAISRALILSMHLEFGIINYSSPLKRFRALWQNAGSAGYMIRVGRAPPTPQNRVRWCDTRGCALCLALQGNVIALMQNDNSIH